METVEAAEPGVDRLRQAARRADQRKGQDHEILRHSEDSLRAIDSKVFYVMVGLSGLLVLLVGSISFRPVPAEEGSPPHPDQQAFFMPFQESRPRLPAGLALGALHVRECRVRERTPR